MLNEEIDIGNYWYWMSFDGVAAAAAFFTHLFTEMRIETV